MGALSSFIEREFSRLSVSQSNVNEDQAPAILAIPAISETNNSNNSKNSAHQNLKNRCEMLQAEADRRNSKATREHSTLRYCRCGSLAECAWNLEGNNQLWRCFRCLDSSG